MSEDNTESLNGNSTNPTPFEGFVRQSLEMILVRQDRMEKEMVERFVHLSRQGMETNEQLREVKVQVAEAREEIRDLDDKIDPFIREQMKLKRNLRDLQESLSPKTD